MHKCQLWLDQTALQVHALQPFCGGCWFCACPLNAHLRNRQGSGQPRPSCAWLGAQGAVLLECRESRQRTLRLCSPALRMRERGQSGVRPSPSRSSRMRMCCGVGCLLRSGCRVIVVSGLRSHRRTARSHLREGEGRVVSEDGVCHHCCCGCCITRRCPATTERLGCRHQQFQIAPRRASFLFLEVTQLLHLVEGVACLFLRRGDGILQVALDVELGQHWHVRTHTPEREVCANQFFFQVLFQVLFGGRARHLRRRWRG
mmetsp:Transcript_39074/g.90505  ORF Transcript_39074/g.90505 Transcript_39074/m.90505 type:complete len:259 (-) Transcript_39074:1783-2559(-)